jgi:hypothetical protein
MLLTTLMSEQAENELQCHYEFPTLVVILNDAQCVY